MPSALQAHAAFHAAFLAMNQMRLGYASGDTRRFNQVQAYAAFHAAFSLRDDAPDASIRFVAFLGAPAEHLHWVRFWTLEKGPNRAKLGCVWTHGSAVKLAFLSNQQHEPPQG